MRKFSHIAFKICASIALVFLSYAQGYSQSVTASENQLKAAYIYNFTQFVEWPSNSFVSSSDPLIIGIYGDDPLDPYLKQIIAGEKIKGHPLVVKNYYSLDDIRSCHILYIASSDAYRVRQVVNSLKGRSVLTISDYYRSMEQGVIVRFYTEGSKLKLQISPEAASAANLTISSKLLKISKIYSSN